MWIVWYAAAIGSLSTLSLLPIMAPTKIERERQLDISRNKARKRQQRSNLERAS